MKISAVKIYTNSFKGNFAKLLEKAKQPLLTQDKIELNKNKAATSKNENGCGGGCGGCEGGCGGGCGGF